MPICKFYVDPLSLSAWTCFFSTLQCAALAVFLVPDANAWKIHSLFELSSYAFAVSSELPCVFCVCVCPDSRMDKIWFSESELNRVGHK